MDKKIDYNQKYIKYKLKYLKTKINIQQNGGYDDYLIFNSKRNWRIYVKKTNGQIPGYMKFGSLRNEIQSKYNINDLDIIYLDYIYPMLTFLQYININRFLMIGLGGGQIPMLISNKFPECQVDIVELDPDVLPAANEMGFTLNENMKLYIEDGFSFIKKSPLEYYDCVIIDLDNFAYINNSNPNDIKNILKHDGIVAINSVSHDENLSSKFLNTFPCIKVYYSNQYVYICSKKNIKEKMNKPLNIDNISDNLKKFKYFDIIINNLNSSKSYVLTN